MVGLGRLSRLGPYQPERLNVGERGVLTLLAKDCIGHCFHSCDSIHDKKQLREEGDSARCGEKVWRQECAVAGHSVLSIHSQSSSSSLGPLHRDN